MPEATVVADLDPEREVHVGPNKGSRGQIVHLDGDCEKLARATSTDSKPATLLDDDRPICSDCRGEYRGGLDAGEDPNATRQKLSGLSPDDVGLSPLHDDDHLVTDGGESLFWDDRDCPRVQCDGTLQQQDQFNVMCLTCEEVWSHVVEGDEHLLVSAAGKIIKRVDVDDGEDWFECACGARYRCRAAALKCCTPEAEGPA